MKEELSSSRQFVRGAARFNDLVYVLTKGKALLEQDIAHTSLLGVDQGNWGSNVDTDWDSTAIAVAKKPSEKLVFVGEDGDVCTYVGGKSANEKIKPAPILIRNAKTVDGLVLACGMRRQVFQRVGERRWVDISAPFSEADEEAGFEAIDGFTLKELYAVGWNGEIWQYNGTKWTNRDSPTNVILCAVCCAADKSVYIGGRQGILIKGRKDAWEIIEWENDVDVDIWDLCWFDGKLYVATISSLYTLNGNQLDEVDFGEIDVSSCFSLTDAEGVMWSIGSEDVLSFDGKSWQRYE